MADRALSLEGVLGLSNTPDTACDMCSASLKDYDPTKRMRCTTCAAQVDCWVNATSWSELLQYNREFVRNQRRATVYSQNPVFEDASLTAGLLHLHDYGCLVIDAQAGSHCVGQENPDADPPGPWYEVKERGYIRFLLPHEQFYIAASVVGELIQHLAAISFPAIEMVSYYEYADFKHGVITPNIAKSISVASYIRVERETDVEPQHHKNLFSTFASAAGRAMSKHRTASTKDGLRGTHWKKCANSQIAVITAADIPGNSQGKRGLGVELRVSRAVKPVIVTVAWKAWPPEHAGQSLARVVEGTMLLVGMKPVFKEENELRLESEEGDELELKEEDKLESKEADGQHKIGGKVSVADAIAESIRALNVG
ncbi:hypothetical protein PMIN06_009340 [Paraphaeosphaeria minitans]|uniref:Uncharacterized protein n=1 Tax=Paraphaeosphaeria minitans TaxID=565426 RepID=A0A9P6KQW9_9PLEO|nr:hypothetical protein PMIN01_06399 [Paraphaeosphaeria minitans]